MLYTDYRMSGLRTSSTDVLYMVIVVNTCRSSSWLNQVPTKLMSSQWYRTSSYLSGTLGAKQLVVDMIQAIFSGLNSWILPLMPPKSVLNSSPSKTFSITTGWNPKSQRTITDIIPSLHLILMEKYAIFMIYVNSISLA